MFMKRPPVVLDNPENIELMNQYYKRDPNELCVRAAHFLVAQYLKPEVAFAVALKIKSQNTQTTAVSMRS